MLIQHPMFWCAVMLIAGTAWGVYLPLPYYLPLLAVVVISSTLLRRFGHWHDVLTLLTWLLIGCSRASISYEEGEAPQWQQTVFQKAKTAQSSLTTRLSESGVSSHTLALTQALVVGKKDELSQETHQAYRQVGASHLLALSGMHLGIIYSLLYFFLVRWVRHSRWRWYFLPLILFSLWGYTLVAGMPVSLVRAALMLSVITITTLMQYRTDPLHPLALSAIIILLVEPAQVFSISFQLSYAAVLFLLLLWAPVNELFPQQNWIIKLFVVSCIATLGTMPLTLYYFHQLPLLGPLLSLILIPLTTLIIWITLATILLPVAPFGWTLNLMVSLQEKILTYAGNIPHTTITDIYPDKLGITLIYAAMLVAIVRLRTRN